MKAKDLYLIVNMSSVVIGEIQYMSQMRSSERGVTTKVSPCEEEPEKEWPLR